MKLWVDKNLLRVFYYSSLAAFNPAPVLIAHRPESLLEVVSQRRSI